MTTVVYNGKSTLELADAADDAAAGINHLTRCADALRYPAEAYRVLGSLTSLADRLPQALEQIRRQLDHWHEAGEVAIDGGEFHDNPDAAITAASTYLRRRTPTARLDLLPRRSRPRRTWPAPSSKQTWRASTSATSSTSRNFSSTRPPLHRCPEILRPGPGDSPACPQTGRMHDGQNASVP